MKITDPRVSKNVNIQFNKGNFIVDIFDDDKNINFLLLTLHIKLWIENDKENMDIEKQFPGITINEKIAKKYYDDIKFLLKKAIRFLSSISLNRFEKYYDDIDYFVEFCINVNNKLSFVDVSFFDYELHNQNIKTRSNYINFPIFDNIIQFAYNKLQDELWDEFNILDQLLTINMERDGLNIKFGKYDIIKTYYEWSIIDRCEFIKQYGNSFGKYINMIKIMSQNMIDCMVESENILEPYIINDLSLSKDGKIQIKEINKSLKELDEEYKNKINEKISEVFLSIDDGIIKEDGKPTHPEIPNDVKADLVRQLCDKTNESIKICRLTLSLNDWNLDKSLDHLNKQNEDKENKEPVSEND